MKIATVGVGERFGTAGVGINNSQDFVVGQALRSPNDTVQYYIENPGWWQLLLERAEWY